jgi:hypothetical protein
VASLALGDRRPDPDATALDLAVGKRVCGLLSVDDEGSATRMESRRLAIRTAEACEGLTPPKAKRLGFVPDRQHGHSRR